MAKLTKAQRGRLEKLAAYLEGLPADYSHFHMGDYLDADADDMIQYALHNGGVPSCGTAACAAGHGPAAGILFPPRYMRKRLFNPVDWDGYCTLFVGALNDPEGSLRYRWCFGGEWQDFDNSHFGAAARIRYLLDTGSYPPGYDADPERDFIALYAPYRIDARAEGIAQPGPVL